MEGTPFGAGGIPVRSKLPSLWLGGVSKKRVENETNTTIILPRKGVENEDIVIKGDSKSGVANACSRILLIVESSRSKMDQTHFISIPLNSKVMQEAQISFVNDVLKLNCDNECEKSKKLSSSQRVIDETIFQTPSLLHLTIGTLSLMDNRERQKACELLEDCKETIIIPLIGTSGLKIEVSGLEIMNDDPAEVDVVYAKIKPVASSSDGDENVLQKIADKIVEKFVATGLMRRQYDRVKLHVTVMNTKFKRSFQEQNEKSTQNSASDENNLKKDAGSTTREKIDAREILNRFGDRHFSTTHINEMHLSQLKTGRRARTGKSMSDENYYAASTIVHLSSCG